MEPFKNWINPQVARQMTLAISRQYPDFDQKKFLKNLERDLAPLELKKRVLLMALRLKECLPDDLKQSLLILRGAIKQNENDEVGLSGFAVWPLTEYVSLFGKEEFDLALDVLKAMTKVFTSEFAVRSFFLVDEKRTLRYFKSWVHDENEHVRRLVSEGSRPLLPWGQKLPGFAKDPMITWELLEILKHDESEYVRKSVANHLNDHSKNHPDLIIEKLSGWKKQHAGNKKIEWIIRHASRTLIKKGHAKAFRLHGVETGKVRVLSQKIMTKKVKLGESLSVLVELQNLSQKKMKVILDHDLHLLRANKKYNIKCFKGKSIELLPLEKTKVSFTIALRPVTTRKYYPGRQFWNIKVNGVAEPPMAFMLDV